MIGLLCFALAVLASPFKSKLQPEAENAVLRHPLNVSMRSRHSARPAHEHDSRVLDPAVSLVSINPAGSHSIRPETLVRW
jgi:hypothetical protein